MNKEKVESFKLHMDEVFKDYNRMVELLRVDFEKDNLSPSYVNGYEASLKKIEEKFYYFSNVYLKEVE